MKEYVLFTGITGGLGSRMARQFNAHNIKAVCLVRKNKNRPEPGQGNFRIINGDITDRESLLGYVGELRGRVDTLVHMASISHGYPEADLYKTIVKGSINLYDFAERIGCSKFLFLSSILAAGWTPKRKSCIDETYIPPRHRLCVFGRMKLLAEHALLGMAAKSSTKVVVLRPGNIYGPPKLSFISFIAKMLKNRQRLLYWRAKDSVMWAPIHIQDAIEAIFSLVKADEFNNKVYFLVGSQTVTLQCLTKLVSDSLGVSTKDMELKPHEKAFFYLHKLNDWKRSILGTPSFPDFIYSNNKIKRELGLYPHKRLEEGVPETVKWAVSQKML